MRATIAAVAILLGLALVLGLAASGCTPLVLLVAGAARGSDDATGPATDDATAPAGGPAAPEPAR